MGAGDGAAADQAVVVGPAGADAEDRRRTSLGL